MIGPGFSVVVGTLDGTTTSIPRPAWAATLAKQNSLRADAGLPPLPDPFNVLQSTPATNPPQP
jgi:hypothetical protein